ncbi:MAG TPA: hypothetical protein DCE42_24890, partial [Myxococcales bacterium]|nr:hypothetical protein [Myxococcales bacterium]
LKDKGKTDISLEVVNRRIPLSRKALGYKDDEFFQLKDGEKLPYRFGAFQCVKDGFNFNTDPDGRHTDGKLGCIFSFEVLHGGPAVQFSKTRLSAARIGDLIISTFPGEATSPVAKALRDGFIAKTGGKLKDVVVLGYAQDHQLYITRENDWWRGGYEATMSTWGFKVGEYLINNAIDLTVQLTTTEKEKNDTGILPVDHYKLDLTPTIERVVTPEAGTIATQPPKEYKRMALEPMTFIISGGWVGVDHPKVVLQKKEGGAFKDVMRDGGQRVYDDADYRMVLEFRKVAADKVHYEYRFQELETFPAGTYRFHVEGQKWDGSKRVPYTVDTDAFEIVPGDNMRVNTVSLEKDQIAAYVSYPAGSNDDGKSDFGALSATGHRLRSSLVRWEVGPPLPENADVDIKITIKDSADKEEIVEVKKLNVYKKDKINIVTKRKEGKETTSEMETQVSGFTAKLPNTLVAGKYTVTIEVKDAHGNTGVWGPKELEIK